MTKTTFWTLLGSGAILGLDHIDHLDHYDHIDHTDHIDLPDYTDYPGASSLRPRPGAEAELSLLGRDFKLVEWGRQGLFYEYLEMVIQ